MGLVMLLLKLKAWTSIKEAKSLLRPIWLPRIFQWGWSCLAILKWQLSILKLISFIFHTDKNIHLFSAHFCVKCNNQILRWTQNNTTLFKKHSDLFHNRTCLYCWTFWKCYPTHFNSQDLTFFFHEPFERNLLKLDFFLHLYNNYEIPAMHQAHWLALVTDTFKNVNF